MIWIVWAVAAAIIGASAATVAFWPAIVGKVKAWLREHNLGKSALTEATVFLDHHIGKIRRIVRVGTRSHGVHKISEEYLSVDQIDDPQLLAELNRTGTAVRDVLPLID
jgi:hypothetical protein